VEGVKAVKSSAETPEGVSATPCVS
jgi:hypothetical protein